MFLEEASRNIPVSHSCDVLVCGGGIAGAAAALAARRHGAEVILAEREYALGGLATLGLIAIYLPICDGQGRQVSFSIAEELLRLSVANGMEDAENPWLTGKGGLEARRKRRFRVQYNPQLFAIELEQRLLAEGVRLLYGTSVCGVQEQDGKITHVIVENKTGRSAIAAGSVVDATGDADICARSSAKTVEYQAGNPLAAWYYYTGPKGYRLHEYGVSDAPHEQTHAEALAGGYRCQGLTAEELTEMVCASHRYLKDAFLKNGPDSYDHALATIATIPQVRMTRRLDTRYALKEKDMFQSFPDSIGMISDWRKPGPVYEVPFGCLWDGRIRNLLVAGRCVGAEDDAWDITRVIPACAVTGQAAGTAAALSRDLTTLPIGELQQALAGDGVRLHISDIAQGSGKTEVP